MIFFTLKKINVQRLNGGLTLSTHLKNGQIFYERFFLPCYNKKEFEKSETNFFFQIFEYFLQYFNALFRKFLLKGKVIL